jgi:ArsR family transcriptional regulator
MIQNFIQNKSCAIRENANSYAMHRSKKAIPPSADQPAKTALKRQAEVFKALGHPGRMAIVHALGHGEVCACDLATVAGCAASTTSRHLTVLRHAGLIADERRGQQVFYRLACPCVLTFAECINRVDAGENVQTLRVACCA